MSRSRERSVAGSEDNKEVPISYLSNNLYYAKRNFNLSQDELIPLVEKIRASYKMLRKS